MKRECSDCGATLRGRSDKKFCDDQCRSNFNNRMKAGIYSSMRPVNSILRKNHAILSKICLKQKVIIKKDDLLKHGFNPDYHTHLHQTQNGNTRLLTKVDFFAHICHGNFFGSRNNDGAGYGSRFLKVLNCANVFI